VSFSPRVCREYPSRATVWSAVSMDGLSENMLTDRQKKTVMV
jgi:hypothetical protein